MQGSAAGGGKDGGQAAGQQTEGGNGGAQIDRRSSKVEGQLNLDPKDKMGENLISKEEYEELSAKFKKANGEEM